MLSVISAEVLKLRHHRGASILTWMWPVGVILIFLIVLAVQLATGSPPDKAPSAAKWVSDAAAFWNAPNNTLVRYLICALTAIVFGGEYGWNTWKLIVPHRSRTALIAAKFVTTLLFLYAAFVVAALLFNLFSWLEDVVSGDAIPPGISAVALAGAHWQGFLASLPPVLLTVAYTSLAAVLTRSTTAGLVIGLVVTTFEELFSNFGPMLSLQAPTLVEFFYRLLPGYHVGNLVSWVREGKAQLVPFPSGTVVQSDWPASLAVTAAWIALLAGLTFYRFRRQDLN